MSRCIAAVVGGVRISRLVRTKVTVRCRECGNVFTAVTNEVGGVTHSCPGKAKDYCGFQVEDKDLVPSDPSHA